MTLQGDWITEISVLECFSKLGSKVFSQSQPITFLSAETNSRRLQELETSADVCATLILKHEGSLTLME